MAAGLGVVVWLRRGSVWPRLSIGKSRSAWVEHAFTAAESGLLHPPLATLNKTKTWSCYGML